MTDAEHSPNAGETSGQPITGSLSPLSIPPGKGFKFSQAGLSWYFALLLFPGEAVQTQAALLGALEKQVEDVKGVAESTEGFAEFAANPEDHPGFFEELEKLPHYSSERWATLAYSCGSLLLDENAPLDDIDRQLVIWQYANFRAMYLFTRHFQDLAWRGYQNYRIDVLVEAVAAWDASDKSEPEEHWQQFLEKQPYLINLIFPGPVAVHTGKAYLGGKKIDNTGGKVVDFLLQHSIGENAALLEIKRPGALLLSKTPYRGDDIYAPSSEVTGSIAQILNYRDTLMAGSDVSPIDVFTPSCVVLVGNYRGELDTPEKRRSFELFRSSLAGVSIVTYDELFDRLKKIIEELRGES